MKDERPEYLAIGHVTRDLVEGGAILGGTCSYSALTAQRLGRRTAIVTSYGPDLPSLAMLEGISIVNRSASVSTTFQNIYFESIRVQKWRASSAPLEFSDVPVGWRRAPIVHLAPIGQEISPALCGAFPESLICVTAQGWLRGRGEDDTVILKPHPDLEHWLDRIDILVMSLADVFGNEDLVRRYLRRAKIGVETLGPAGCRIYLNGEVYQIPVRRELEVDPTGAGDIFAAAFFVHYSENREPIQAGMFANACASLSVSKVGLAGIPHASAVQRRMAELYAES